MCQIEVFSAAEQSALFENLGFRDRHEFLHFGADIRFARRRSKIARHFAVDILVTGFLEIGLYDFLRIGVGILAGFAQKLSRPEPKKLVAARFHLEPDFGIMCELVFEGVFAFVEGTHRKAPCYTGIRYHSYAFAALGLQVLCLPQRCLCSMQAPIKRARRVLRAFSFSEVPMARRKKVYEGKAKILYEGPEPGTLVQYFKDDATAFNAQKKDVIDGKGVLNNRLSEFFMKGLAQIGVPTHFIKRLNMREQLIRAVEIIPLEVIVRNYAAGTLSQRLGLEEGTMLPRPIVEFCLKDDALGDPLVAEEHIIAFGWASQQDLDDMVALALRVNDFMSGCMLAVGIKLVDFKIEIGRVWDGEFQRLVVADEISPDSCRLWDMETGQKLDKDVFRRDLGDLADAYTEVARRLGVLPSNVTHAAKPTLIN